MIPIKPNTTSSVGYGFVQLSTSSEAQRAMSELSGKIVDNRKISVQMSKEAKPALKDVEAAAQAGILLTDEGIQNTLAVQSTSIEAKRKAQTDLARQKMEALKSRTVPQRQTPMSSSVAPPMIHPHPLPQIPPPSVLHVNSAPQAQASNLTQTTPHGSYFSPSNERQAFSIPGLFVAPARSSCTVEKEQPVISPPTAHQGNPQVATSVPSGDTTVYVQALASLPTAVDASNRKPNLVLTAETLEKPANSASRVNEPRQRQRASDFIDSPPMRPKRTLGQRDDISVIIDVSEDEVDDESETESDAMDIDQDTDINSNPRQLQHEGMETSKKRAIRDLPPLTDFPARKKLSDSSAFNTPPAVETPGKLKEQEGLKTKEKKIELMKRRIAELEQRTKAKQTSSRAQTPGTPGHATSPQRPMETRVGDNEQSGSSVTLTEPIREQQQAEALTLLTPKTTRAIVGEEKRVVEVENQNDRLPAASEILQTVKQVISEDQQERPALTHLKEFEPTRMDIDQSQAAQVIRTEERQQSSLGEPHTKEITQSPAETNRLPAPEAPDMDEEQQRLIPEQHIEDLAHSNTDQERSRSSEVETSEEEQRQRRRAEIESGLPILDAEVERTKQRLQELRKQMEDLESEVQKGLQGRRNLVEELVSLSPVSSPTLKASSHKGQESADKPGNKPQTENIPGK